MNAILATTGAQGDDLKKLIEYKMTDLIAHLEATLVNLQNRTGQNKKMGETVRRCAFLL